MKKQAREMVEAEARELDSFARAIASVLVDSEHPFNKLARPAKRICSCCGESYKSRVSFLADGGYCADCIAVPDEVLVNGYLTARGYTSEDRLLAAIFGWELI